MKILITGYTGFVGSMLTKRLAEQGHDLIGLDISKSDSLNSFIDEELGDIRNIKDVDRVMPHIDLVLHVAALYRDDLLTQNNLESNVPFYDINVGGTQILLKSALEHNVVRFFFFSSVSVYGYGDCSRMESSPHHPDHEYGMTKHKAEEAVLAWQEFRYNVHQAIILRPAVIFGEGEHANMIRLVKQIDKGHYVNVGDGKNIKSVSYIRNVVEATLFLIDRMRPGCQIFNYSDQPDRTAHQLAELIHKGLGKSGSPIMIPYWIGIACARMFDGMGWMLGKELSISSNRLKTFLSVSQIDSSKIREFGFVQPYSIEEGLKNLIEWYKKDSQQG